MRATALILAAGAGTRMRSDKPKVAFEMLGKPLVRWVADAAREAGCDRVVAVLGHGREVVAPLVPDAEIVVQEQRKGTGHAVLMAADLLREQPGPVVVLSGDCPLVRPVTIESMVAEQQRSGAAAVVLTFAPDDPFGYGRVVRASQLNGDPRPDDDLRSDVLRIVEQADCTPEQAAIRECNSGMYCFDSAKLLDALGRIGNDNAQGEYYLTDVVGVLRESGERACAIAAADPSEALGINSRAQLAQATKRMQRRINEAHMDAGVGMIDPDLVWIGPDVRIEPDAEIWPMSFLMGATSIGRGTRVGPNSRITDCTVGQRCVVDESVLVEAVLDDGVSCGPRAYLRPGTHMMEGSKAGTHVEIKKSTIGKGSKVPHLSYIGDTTMGDGVNIGAGSITCNYDGRAKHPTRIGDGAFVGSDTMMVAPVEIGANSVIGAGSTITKDVPPRALGIARGKQRNYENWSKSAE